MLNKTAQKFLIELAKKTIHQQLHETYITVTEKQNELNQVIPFGAFVSVYVQDELHGCIGRFSNNKPIIPLIETLSISSAFNDRRFAAIGTNDLHALVIEISILSPLRQIYHPNEITIGKHGIYIKQNYNKGTLLPQVATKNNWNAEEFVRYCSKHKAGLGWDGWKNAELYTYTAEIFRG